MTRQHPYSMGLDRSPANYVPLSPLSFIERTAAVYPQRTSIIYGETRQVWSQTYARCRRLASALERRGIGRGDTVAVMLPNTPPMIEAHFGVPMLGAVLNTLNTRLDAEAIAFMLEHGEARVLITDCEFSPVVSKALAMLGERRPLVIDVRDPHIDGGETLGALDYEALLAEGDPGYAWSLPQDEWEAIALNYTSGTTGNPKGVVYHHRGAHLNSIANIVTWGMPAHAVYLWTLPMFHCNGWCFPWTLAANAGTHVCLRRVDPVLIFELIKQHRVTHFCGAPIVHSMLINAPESSRQGLGHPVAAMIAGAAPPAAIIEGMERIGVSITHAYGLTETYGPAAICARQPEWETLPLPEKAERHARQGVPNHLQQAMAVLDPQTMQPVPADGETMGEIMFRGNIVMKGYLKNPTATEESLAGGWFHSGDLAVVQSDGYVKIRDRSKDVIISGGENISSIEVEDALYRHPAVMAAAVVAKLDDKWGEVPCACVELREGSTVTPEELVEHCRRYLARFKVPRHVVIGPLPKTSTGKIQKFLLRQRVA
ncbi:MULTISPECIES: acyl-CoA synthetase [Hydrocarboniphaga]|jgi:fatty-acyl-CoA synthase|uniref:Acyl-CoA synthetase n=1 Tax=Hydrocarboniphaga effusa AP103 TaxID=1172194 RepID=I7ZJI7_9GAMM|nr:MULTISPECIES: acyl-CoA synthetase [Hydrocarboniphaga]EIT71927.1 acyl-CoA synthetase [Hydrocarboniphaga effusa AP103]MDZ4077369.1 acyl-CoA synthetase [Hydrocarboniphaga sp.]